MDDLRERFERLEHSVAALDVPDLLGAAETRAPGGVERLGPLRPRRTFVAITAVLVLAAAAVGWAYLTSSARDTVSIQCMINGSSTVIPSVIGNPVADCAAEWQKETGSAPKLAAYDNGHGAITVLLASEQPPEGWTRLPKGATQNVSMVKMQEWLDDYVTGLNSGCYDSQTAVRMTQQMLNSLGMTNWAVEPAPSADDGPCVDTGVLNPATFTVELRSLGDEPANAPFEQLAMRLRSTSNTCQSLDAAERQVRAAAAEVGLSAANDYELHVAPDDIAHCTTIYENVGGTIVVILRGPSN